MQKKRRSTVPSTASWEIREPLRSQQRMNTISPPFTSPRAAPLQWFRVDRTGSLQARSSTRLSSSQRSRTRAKETRKRNIRVSSRAR